MKILGQHVAKADDKTIYITDIDHTDRVAILVDGNDKFSVARTKHNYCPRARGGLTRTWYVTDSRKGLSADKAVSVYCKIAKGK